MTAGGPAEAGVGEDAVVASIAAALGRAGARSAAAVLVGIGDDAAVVAPPPGPLVLATDAVVAGVHADLSLTTLGDLGWKALAATVSDIGALGARPCHALLTLCAPAGADVLALAEGVAQASAAFSCPVVGGDVTEALEVVVSVAATGALDGPEPPVLRGGARPGDALFVTGPLGASAAGLRLLRAGGGVAAAGVPAGGRALVDAHRRPVPRLAEGVTARHAGATAMMDVSDGLALDLHRLADASGVGFSLDHLPVADGASEGEALSGGEDYELVIATGDPDRLLGAFARAGLRPPAAIGTCVADRARRELAGRPLGRAGWQHAVGPRAQRGPQAG